MAVIINPLEHVIDAVRCSVAVLQTKVDCDGSSDDDVTEGTGDGIMDGICVGRVFPE
jgi:hypothetical protein